MSAPDALTVSVPPLSVNEPATATAPISCPDHKRSASVVASSKAFCLAVDQKFLEHMMPKEENSAFYAALYEFIAKLTAKRLKATSEQLARLDQELRDLKASLASS